jgi:hypothetical protein
MAVIEVFYRLFVCNVTCSVIVYSFCRDFSY